MNIGLTGSTAGIGKAILKLPFTFITYDRANGDLADVEKVYEKLKGCDVFINNAWDGECQVKLLLHFFGKWKHTNKKILSIGSSVASYSPTGNGYGDYVLSKKRLRETHCDIVNLKEGQCKSYLVNPGITDTKMTASQNTKKMTPDQVAEIVSFVLTNELYIPEVYFYAQ